MSFLNISDSRFEAGYLFFIPAEWKGETDSGEGGVHETYYNKKWKNEK